MKGCFVTGANGWIGSHATQILRERGFEIFPIKMRDLDKTATMFMGDFYLLHLAWITTPGLYWESPENTEWFENSLKLFQRFKRAGGKRIVVAGTCAEITNTLYGRSKNALRKVLEAYSDITGVSSAWGRIFYLYGPYEKPERLISSTIISLLRGEEVVIDKPEQSIDFLHVYDVASALVSILDSDVTGTVEIGEGSPWTIKRTVQIISEKIGRPELVKFGNVPEPLFVKSDPRRLHNEVGFKPKFNLLTGLDDTIEWWRKELGVNG